MLSGSDLPRAFSRDKCCSCSYRFAPWKWCQLSSSFAFSLEARAKHWALHFLLLARVWLPHLQRVVTVGFEFNEKFIVWENQWDQCIGRKTFHKVPSIKNTWKNVVISTIFFGTKGGVFIKHVFKIWKFSLKKGGVLLNGGFLLSNRRYWSWSTHETYYFKRALKDDK